MADSLRCATNDFIEGISPRKLELLDCIVDIVLNVERCHRRRLLPLPSKSLLFRIVYGQWLDQMRLERAMTGPWALQKVLMDMDKKYPVHIRATDDAAYRKRSRGSRLRSTAASSTGMLHPESIDGRAPQDRIARARANLTSFLGSRRCLLLPKRTDDITGQIGRYSRDKLDRIHGSTTLEKHVRMIAIDNGWGAKPVNIDVVLPDMTACMEMAVAKRWEVKSMERRYDIARRVPMPPGLIFLGVTQGPW